MFTGDKINLKREKKRSKKQKRKIKQATRKAEELKVKAPKIKIVKFECAALQCIEEVNKNKILKAQLRDLSKDLDMKRNFKTGANIRTDTNYLISRLPSIIKEEYICIWEIW